jgi:hypothetical protein
MVHHHRCLGNQHLLIHEEELLQLKIREIFCQMRFIIPIAKIFLLMKFVVSLEWMQMFNKFRCFRLSEIPATDFVAEFVCFANVLIEIRSVEWARPTDIITSYDHIHSYEDLKIIMHCSAYTRLSIRTNVYGLHLQSISAYFNTNRSSFP